VTKKLIIASHPTTSCEEIILSGFCPMNTCMCVCICVVLFVFHWDVVSR
jgi:hypothetical protein